MDAGGRLGEYLLGCFHGWNSMRHEMGPVDELRRLAVVAGSHSCWVDWLVDWIRFVSAHIISRLWTDKHKESTIVERKQAPFPGWIRHD
jgi:hypothetical protein